MWIHTYIHTYTHTHIVYTYVHTCTHNIYIYVIHTDIFITYIHTYVHTYNKCSYTFLFNYIHTYIHTYKQTNIVAREMAEELLMAAITKGEIFGSQQMAEKEKRAEEVDYFFFNVLIYGMYVCMYVCRCTDNIFCPSCICMDMYGHVLFCIYVFTYIICMHGCMYALQFTYALEE